ncbi:uncharacterized protein METZ01_LOCUS286348, partial [marine metagenome]
AYLLTSSSTSLPVAYGKVVINEINYNPLESGTDTTEFIELYNHSTSAVDLSGVKENNAIVFTFPAGASIAAGGYIVLAVDSTKFHNRYGSAPDYEWTSGALGNSGEDIELVDSSGARIDYVDFEDGYSSSEQAAGWNAATDGGGPTYELIDPASDNSLGTSWQGWGVSGGTPGSANSLQPNLSMGSSITSYVGAGTSRSSTFQLNNNGASGLTVDSVVASQYVPGTTFLSEDFDDTWSGSPAAPSGWLVVNNDGDNYTWSRSATYVPEVNTYGAHGMGSQDDYLISPALTLSGSSLIKWWDVVESATKNNTYDVLVSTTTSDIASFTANLGTFDCTNTALTEHELSLSAYAGSTIYVAFHQTYSAATYYGFAIDDVSVEAAGANVAPAWLTGTAPAAAIAAKDS